MMRDFRDAKAMAHTLRAALAAQGLKITNSQSLELIAEAFGVADWNTLSAAIRAADAVPLPSKVSAPPPQLPIAESVEGVRFSVELEATLHRALGQANQRKHQYATLEHLLLALSDDADASAVLRACAVDLGVLKHQLAIYVDFELAKLIVDDGSDAKPTAAFQRVVQRAVLHVRGLGRQTVTGAQILLGLFSERESPAAKLLAAQNMTRLDAANFITHGIGKESRGAADDP
jgi:Glyoxalase superfamily protein/Clp amino terminal domain, pathogenicity island component